MSAATRFRCPRCGAELPDEPRKSGADSGGACPYLGLEYPVLRAGHDAIYFGQWRRMDASPLEILRAYRRLERHLDEIGKAVAGKNLPAVRDLALAREAFRTADPKAESREALRFMDNALSYAHRAIDDLLREKGVPPHRPMDFAQWYDAVEVPFRDEW